MKTLSEQVIADAFALSNARGAELLARLGSFDVWRGDLATMRGDDPRTPDGYGENDEPTVKDRALGDTLMLARAIEDLPPICRAALAAVYADRRDPSSLAADLDTEPADAQRIITSCEQRLQALYEAIANRLPAETATVPEWVSEREHAAAGGNRRG